MEINNYGITLRRLTRDKIEMVRNWRNDPKIQRFMEFRDYITPEMQQKWFDRINNDNNYYFIIVFRGKEIGLTNIKDIDYEKGTGEGGIFIYDDEYLNSDISFRCAMCTGDFIFYTLKLKLSLAHICRDNKRAIQYNKLLGLKLAENQENNYNQLYTLNKEDFEKSAAKIKRLLQ